VYGSLVRPSCILLDAWLLLLCWFHRIHDRLSCYLGGMLDGRRHVFGERGNVGINVGSYVLYVTHQCHIWTLTPGHVIIMMWP